MKPLLLASVFALGMVSASFAGNDDVPGANWITKSDLMKRMEAKGFTSIVAEADDGYWEGEAVKDGKIVEFHADPITGDTTKTSPKDKD